MILFTNLSSLALYMKMIQFLLMPLFTFWLCTTLELGEWLSLCCLDKLFLWNWFSHDVSYYLFFFWSLFLVDTVSYHILCQIFKGWHTKLNIIEIKWTTQIFSCWCIKIRASRVKSNETSSLIVFQLNMWRKEIQRILQPTSQKKVNWVADRNKTTDAVLMAP